MKLAEIAVHRDCYLGDVSSDGKSMLLWFTRTPIQHVTIPGESGAIVRSENTLGDELRLVEVSTGRILHSRHLPNSISNARLIPGLRAVLVSWRGKDEDEYGKWDVDTSSLVRIASGAKAIALGSLVPVNAQTAVGTIWSKEAGSSMIRVGLQAMETEAAVKAMPSGEKAQIGAGGLALSKGKDIRIAYVLGLPRRSIVVRDLVDLKVKQEINPPEGYAFGRATLSTDGKILVADAFLRNTGPALQLGAVHEVFVYDTQSGKLNRRFNIDGRYGLVISPDNRFLVAGRKRNGHGANGRVQAVAGVYSLESGRELGSIEHPAVREPRDNPFVAVFQQISFTSDGQYLVTSTQEVRIWRIEVE